MASHQIVPQKHVDWISCIYFI